MVHPWRMRVVQACQQASKRSCCPNMFSLVQTLRARSFVRGPRHPQPQPGRVRKHDKTRSSEDWKRTTSAQAFVGAHHGVVRRDRLNGMKRKCMALPPKSLRGSSKAFDPWQGFCRARGCHNVPTRSDEVNDFPTMATDGRNALRHPPRYPRGSRKAFDLGQGIVRCHGIEMISYSEALSSRTPEKFSTRPPEWDCSGCTRASAVRAVGISSSFFLSQPLA